MERRDLLKSLLALPGVASIAVEKVTANDVIVVESDRVLSMHQADNIRQLLRKTWPEPQKIVVLDSSLKMKIVRDTA